MQLINFFENFHTEIYKFKFRYSNKNKLLTDIINRYNKNPELKPTEWHESVHSSFYYDQNCDTFLFNKSGIPVDLVEEIGNTIRPIYLKKQLSETGTFFISGMWYNAYKQNQYQNPHRHNHETLGITFYSGIWYLKYNKNVHNPTRFYNPNFEVDPTLIKNNKYFCYSPDIEEDDLIVFPSNIKHDVSNQISDELRITISFNIDCNFFVKD